MVAEQRDAFSTVGQHSIQNPVTRFCERRNKLTSCRDGPNTIQQSDSLQLLATVKVLVCKGGIKGNYWRYTHKVHSPDTQRFFLPITHSLVLAAVTEIAGKIGARNGYIHYVWLEELGQAIDRT
ncbi:predicted protein [Pyrenophora tritici-repentis Pt-1C-BFP]|uniref:Uncharacterized protein n=1 Tax=Pyrenophora tritici-repentis (strain Pt-1C-BFP) TaxID=426418 RepID=B2WD23_PYRTR|nr:uncharacterized protein PTRG_07882 [Pyrenophora tritici-repentis Pt-1C-BFP]EDU50801.1 predicted protein [Pyrenophora tritici-repentis Pt-1C-BFP]